MIYSKKAIRQMLYQAYRAGERDGAACPARANRHSLSLQNLRINELRKLYPALYAMRPDDARRRHTKAVPAKAAVVPRIDSGIF
jgi:hypothetical protein